MTHAVERARQKYLPEDGIKILFVAEAPPVDPNRFFYFEHVDRQDGLFLELMRALYPDSRRLTVPELRARKSLFLRRFQADGHYLIDASDRPMPRKASRATKCRLLQASLSDFVSNARALVTAETPVVLISRTVFDICRDPLLHAGCRVVNSEMIDFPGSGQQEHFRRKIFAALRPLVRNEGPVAWTKTSDGSILDAAGAVVYFSCKRFVESIFTRGACFVCGAVPGDKDFNDEHVVPDWILREFDLFNRHVTLPNGAKFQYSRYKIPCCADCNSEMGRVVETPISKLLHSGYDAVADYVRKNGALSLYLWMALIFVKTHLRDRSFNLTLDRRMSRDPIASLYEWEALHHIHTVARSFKTNAEIRREVIGTCVVLPAKVEGQVDAFDYADLYDAQVALIRFRDVALVSVFNDSTAVTSHLLRYLQDVTGPLSSAQVREVMVEAACCNLHLKNRPQYASLVDLRNQTNRIVAVLPSSVEFHPVDLTLRGKLMEHALRPVVSLRSIDGYPNIDDFWRKVLEGRQSFLYDDNGKFIA